MPASDLTYQAPHGAANRRLAASSAASVAFGYERSLRPCDSRFSRLLGAICSDGDR
jgi:hypothetical protein